METFYFPDWLVSMLQVGGTVLVALFAAAKPIARYIVPHAIGDMIDARLTKFTTHIEGLDKEHSDARSQLGKRVGDIENKVQFLSQQISVMPTHKEVGDIKIKIAELEGSIKAVDAKLDGVGKLLKQINVGVTLLQEAHIKE